MLEAGLLKTPAVADEDVPDAAPGALAVVPGRDGQGRRHALHAATRGAGVPRTAARRAQRRGSALRLAYNLEQSAAATYQAAVGNVDNLELNVALMSVGGVEARHVVVLGGLVDQPQVPASGFAATDKAVAPGTGL